MVMLSGGGGGGGVIFCSGRSIVLLPAGARNEVGMDCPRLNLGFASTDGRSFLRVSTLLRSHMKSPPFGPPPSVSTLEGLSPRTGGDSGLIPASCMDNFVVSLLAGGGGGALLPPREGLRRCRLLVGLAVTEGRGGAGGAPVSVMLTDGDAERGGQYWGRIGAPDCDAVPPVGGVAGWLSAGAEWELSMD